MGYGRHVTARYFVRSWGFSQLTPGVFVQFPFDAQAGDLLTASVRVNADPRDLAIGVFNRSQYQDFVLARDFNTSEVVGVNLAGPLPDGNLGDLLVRFVAPREGSYHLVVMNNATTGATLGFGSWLGFVAPAYYEGLVIWATGTVFLAAGAAMLSWRHHRALGVFWICFGVKSLAFFLGITRTTNWANDFVLFHVLDFEPYEDYKAYYLAWAAYMDGRPAGALYEIPTYIYMPLYMPTLLPFYEVFPWWGMALPLVAASTGSGIVTYLIGREVFDDPKHARFAMALALLNPIALFYTDYLWMNPALFAFFSTLAIYCCLKDWHVASGFVLGVAVMYKQPAAIFLPVLLIAVLKWDAPPKRRARKIFKLAGCLAAFAVPVVLASIPHVVADFARYFSQAITGQSFLGVTSQLTRRQYQLGYPVNFVTFFATRGFSDDVINALAFAVSGYLPLIGCAWTVLLLLLLAGWRDKPRLEKGVTLADLAPPRRVQFLDARAYHRRAVTRLVKFQYLLACTFLVLIFQLFYPRGAYKYYLVLVVPFLSVCLHVTALRTHGNAVRAFSARMTAWFSAGGHLPGNLDARVGPPANHDAEFRLGLKRRDRVLVLPVSLSFLIMAWSRYSYFWIVLGLGVLLAVVYYSAARESS